MLLPPNSKFERVVAMCVKASACGLLAMVEVAHLYFTFAGFADGSKPSGVTSIFSLLFSLAISAPMLVFLYGAAKTSVNDYVIEIRLLRRHGFRKMKHMTAEEFDRLSALERSIDEEILQRTKERARKRSHGA